MNLDFFYKTLGEYLVIVAGAIAFSALWVYVIRPRLEKKDAQS